MCNYLPFHIYYLFSTYFSPNASLPNTHPIPYNHTPFSHNQRNPTVDAAAGWKIAYHASYADIHNGGYPQSKWAWYFICLNIGAGYVVGTTPMGNVAKPTTNLEQFVSCAMCLLGAATRYLCLWVIKCLLSFIAVSQYMQSTVFFSSLTISLSVLVVI